LTILHGSSSFNPASLSSRVGPDHALKVGQTNLETFDPADARYFNASGLRIRDAVS